MKPVAPLAIVLLVTLTLACSDSGPAGLLGRVSEQNDSAPASLVLANRRLEDADAGPAGVLSERKLIRTGELSVEVEDVGAAIDEAAAIAETNGGFLSDRRVIQDDEGHQSANVTLRVPSDRFDSAVAELGNLGEVERESTTTEDITKAYLDLETRLRVKRDTEQRFRQILQQHAGDVSQVLEVERELGRVIEEIERMEGERRYYDRRTTVSTIQVAIHEPDAVIRAGSLSPLSEAFAQSLRVLTLSVAALIYVVTFLVPWLLLASLAWWLVQTIRRRWGYRSSAHSPS